MKLRAIPLLETTATGDHDGFRVVKEEDEVAFEIDWTVGDGDGSSLGRQFVSLMDQYKVLILQRRETNSTTTTTTTTTTTSDGSGASSIPTNGDSASPPPFTVEDFGQFVVDLELEYYPYIGGAAPRTIIPVSASPDRVIVFTTNESPPDQPIPFHHELAQTANPPKYIFFYCETPAEKDGGGETPIIDSTAVYRYVSEQFPEFLAKLKDLGVRYIRTLPAVTDPTSPIGRSYQDTYNVSTPEELEEKLKAIDGCSWEWNEADKSVRIVSAAIPAIRMVDDSTSHAYAFQYTFCNSIIAAYLGWQDSRNDRKNAVRFGDMTVMDEAILEKIASFMNTNRILYPWKKGDIMAIHNQMIMHSRNPFVGNQRRILSSMWGPLRDDLLNQQPLGGVAVGIRPHYVPLVPSDPLVFGFWKVPKETCADVCYNAIKSGYRRLDCACDYGNESEVGIGIQRAIGDGLCTRDDLFITSKLWNTYHHPTHVKMACQRSLMDLQLEYLDEYLIHFPISMEYVPFETKYPPEWTNLDGKMVIVPNDLTNTTWAAMENLVDDGLCKTIGVCNFSTQLLRQLLSTCRIRPATLQVEIHPHNSQQRLVQFAQQAGMKVTAFSIFGASSYVELNMATTEQSLLVPSTKSVIGAIAAKKNKTPAQIIVRWCIQRNILPLCKTSTLARMIENRNVFDFYLTKTEMDQINELNKNHRYNDPGEFCYHAFGTFCPIYD